jgi:hypothetical protein
VQYFVSILSDAYSGRMSSRGFFMVIVLFCYLVTYILSFKLSGIVLWYFDRVACSAVVDHFGESLPVLWDECVDNRVSGDCAAVVCRFCLLKL